MADFLKGSNEKMKQFITVSTDQDLIGSIAASGMLSEQLLVGQLF